MSTFGKVLVTGGSGFLGINLIRHLLEQGVTEIRSLDVAEFSYPERDRVEIIHGDIRDEELVARSMEGVRWVIHTAAALPLYSPEDIYSTDVDGTRILRHAHKNAPVARVAAGRKTPGSPRAGRDGSAAFDAALFAQTADFLGIGTQRRPPRLHT